MSEAEPEAKYPSQRLPQLSAVRLAKDQVWLLDAIAKYQRRFLETNGAPIEAAQVVRMALAEVIAAGGPKHGLPAVGDTALTMLGPFRLTEPYRTLPATIERTARKLDASKSDVIRGALLQWFTAKGYGRKKKR